jgi:tetratricopeptide (TPR) repeat protein
MQAELQGACRLNPTMPISDADARVTALNLVQEVDRLADAGRFSAAGQSASRAVALARRCGDLPLLGTGLVSLGQLEYQAGRHLSAYAAASEAFRLLGECGDITRQLMALNTCAGVQAGSGNVGSAIELLRQGLQLAVGESYAWVRCQVLYNLAAHLLDCDEYREAIECRTEAVSITTQTVQLAAQRDSMATGLAQAHSRYAEYLSRQGHRDAADERLKAAARCLPAMARPSWRTVSRREAYRITVRAEVLSALGQWDAARFAAAVSLRFARRSANNPVLLGWAFVVVAKLYRCQGRLQRSTHHESRALALWRAVDNKPDIVRGLGRLSELHAMTGAYQNALALRKEQAVCQSHHQKEAGALRSRLAAIERQAERRRQAAEEARVHAQRLAIIGRLIAQTHHALSAPIARARHLAAEAMACAGSRDALRPLLAEINHAIDRAAGLVSQLKLFSYRSSPQPMVLSLHESLLDAWKGMSPHIASRSADLHISGPTRLRVWGDAQRLGIMLKVLLIELAQQAGADGAAVLINASIEAGEPDTVLLHIEACCRLPASAAAPGPSLGAALCMEIAAEMQGELQPAHNDDAVLRYRLQLPQPQPQLRVLPGTLA